MLVLSFTLTACTLQDLPVIGKYLGNVKLPWGGKSLIEKEANLTMWGLWEQPDVMESVIQSYKAEHPKITITYEDRSVLKPDNYRERVFARADSDIGADIILVHNSWVPRLKDNLAPMPSSLMSVDEYTAAFYPTAVQSAVADGKIYAVPLYYDGLVLVYNKDHFAEIGQQEPPTAWEEFRRLALRLSVRAGEEGKSVLVRSGAALGTANNNEHFSDILGLMFSQTDVSVPDELGTKPAADALDFYTTFAKQDNVWNNSFPEANVAFVQGKTSMIFVPSWRIVDLLAANPNLNFGVAPVPQAIPDKPANWASYWMLTVPSSSKNQDAAWNFIKYLTSEEEELSMFNEASKYRPFGVPYARVALAPQLAAHPYLGPLLSTAPTAKSGDVAARVGNAKIVEDLRKAVNAVLDGRVDSATALKNVKDGKEQPEK